MSKQDRIPTKAPGNAPASFIPLQNPSRVNSGVSKIIYRTTSADRRNGKPMQSLSRDIEPQRRSLGPNVSYIAPNAFKDTNGVTRVPRPVSPDWEMRHNPRFWLSTHHRPFFANDRPEAVPTVGASSGTSSHVEQESIHRPVPPSSSLLRNTDYYRERTGSTTDSSRVIVIDRTERSELGRDIHYPTLPLAASIQPPSANFLVAFLPPPVNLVRRYAPHALQMGVESTNRCASTSHSVSMTFNDDIPFTRAAVDQTRFSSADSASIPGCGTFRQFEADHRRGIPFPPRQDSRSRSYHDLWHVPRVTISDGDSDHENEDFFTPEASPPSSPKNALVSQDANGRFVPQPYPPAFVSSPPLQHVRSPATVSRAGSYFGPYVPDYPTPMPSIPERSMGNGRVRLNRRASFVPEASTSLPRLDNTPPPIPLDGTVQPQAYPTFQLMNCTIHTINTVHANPD